MHVRCSSKQEYVGPVHSELQCWERSSGRVGGLVGTGRQGGYMNARGEGTCEHEGRKRDRQTLI